MNIFLKYVVLAMLGSFSVTAYSAEHSAHHDFPPTVDSFHDVLAPLWHSPAGEQRAQRTCKQSSQLALAADNILRAETPKSVSGEQWGIATENLRQSVAALSKNCTKKLSTDITLADIHDKFHGLVRLVGHKHDTASEPMPPALGAASPNGSIPTSSKKDDTDLLAVSDAFSECAALQNTLADLAATSEDEYESHPLHQSGKDAFTIATDLAVAAGREKQLAQFQYERHISRFKNSLDKTEGGYQRFAEEVKPIIQKCAALNGIQNSLIAERRKQNYGEE